MYLSFLKSPFFDGSLEERHKLVEDVEYLFPSKFRQNLISGCRGAVHVPTNQRSLYKRDRVDYVKGHGTALRQIILIQEYIYENNS